MEFPSLFHFVIIVDQQRLSMAAWMAGFDSVSLQANKYMQVLTYISGGRQHVIFFHGSCHWRRPFKTGSYQRQT